MPKSIICEGKTTEQALENGLKILKVSKDKVNIKTLENEDKRSFFSILAPRVVKLELTLKDEKEIATDKKNGNSGNSRGNSRSYNNQSKREEVIEPRKEYIEKEEARYNKNEEDLNKALEKIKEFMAQFVKNLPTKDIAVECFLKDYCIYVEIKGADVNYLIGYRGETLNSIQHVLSSIINTKGADKIRLIVDIEGYREKREKTLNELADKISKTVTKTGKSVTLEPMSSYERKIIHSRLQGNDKIKTFSTGEEPYRKLVITLK